MYHLIALRQNNVNGHKSSQNLISFNKKEEKRISGKPTVRKQCLATQQNPREERGHTIMNKSMKRTPPEGLPPAKHMLLGV